MSHLTVSNEHSHLFGREILQQQHAPLHQEIRDLLLSPGVPKAIERGRFRYHGKDFKTPLTASLKALGWIKVASVLKKGRIGLNMQFDEHATPACDLRRFEDVEIDAGVYVVPSRRLFEAMYPTAISPAI